MSPDRSASLLARLLAQAKRTDVEHGHLLHRFMIERLLARLAASDHGDRFVLKDFFDLGVIARRTRLDGAALASAIAATFARRNTPLPAQVPVALTTDFALAPPKQAQWAAFHARLRLSATPLPATVALLHDLL